MTEVAGLYVYGGVFDFTIKINFVDGDSDGWTIMIGLNFDAHFIIVSLLILMHVIYVYLVLYVEDMGTCLHESATGFRCPLRANYFML